MTDQVVQYPTFLVFFLADTGPQLWAFDTAKEVSAFMWGRSATEHAIFKGRDRKMVAVPADIEDIKVLEEFLKVEIDGTKTAS